MTKPTEYEDNDQSNLANKISYGGQVAIIAIGVILGIISSIILAAFIFFGDAIRAFF